VTVTSIILPIFFHSISAYGEVYPNKALEYSHGNDTRYQRNE